jgi:hypothetical protein
MGIAKKRGLRRLAGLKDYYIYDPCVGRDLGGFPVFKTGNGELIVKLTPEQADHFKHMGLLGDVPLSEVKGEKLRYIHQLTAGRVPLEDGTKATVRVAHSMGLPREGIPGKRFQTTARRTVRQAPGTSATAIVGGGNFMTGNAVSDAAIPSEIRSAAKQQLVTKFEGYEGVDKSDYTGRKTY